MSYPSSMPVTLKAYEATLDPDGRIHSDEPLHLKRPTRVIVTVATDEDESPDLAKASEAAWAKDWNQLEEDEAWASLQEEK